MSIDRSSVEQFLVLTKKGTLLRGLTKKKFEFELDNYLWLDRTGVITEVSLMSDVEEFLVKNPKTNQVDRQLTIEKFESELDTYLEERTKDARKYRSAVLAVFKKFSKGYVGRGQVESFALYEAGLELKKESQDKIHNTISQLLEDGVLEASSSSRGKGAGIKLAEDQPTEVEADEAEEEPAPPAPKKTMKRVK